MMDVLAVVGDTVEKNKSKVRWLCIMLPSSCVFGLAYVLPMPVQAFWPTCCLCLSTRPLLRLPPSAILCCRFKTPKGAVAAAEWACTNEYVSVLSSVALEWFCTFFVVSTRGCVVLLTIVTLRSLSGLGSCHRRPIQQSHNALHHAFKVGWCWPVRAWVKSTALTVRACCPS